MGEISIRQLFNDILNYSGYDHSDKIFLFELETISSYVLGSKKIDLYLDDRIVDASLFNKICDKVDELKNGKPLAYILGFTQFRGLELITGPGVLIPRNETEYIVDIVSSYINKGAIILDVGTGSGAIALSVAQEHPEAQSIGVDISCEALSYAEQNKVKNSIKNVSFKISDLCSSINENSVDIMIANLPYISEKEYRTLDNSVRLYEPKLALTSGVTGLELIEKLIIQSKLILKNNGLIVLEIGFTQAERVRELFYREKLFSNIKVIKDYNNLDRFISANIHKSN